VSANSPRARPTGPRPAEATTVGGETDADLDWARRTIVELDDRQRALAPDDIAGRHAILQAMDDLRSMLRQGYADELREVQARWMERSGHKGSHEIDFEAIAGMVRSMMPSQGR
jgi:hypothetical protein